MSTLRTTNIKNPDSIGNNLILDESGGVVISGVTTVTTLNATQITGVSGGMVVSGVTTVSAGSTSAPSISPSGDSNTGVFFPSADTVALSSGGTERIKVDSSGNIDIDSGGVYYDAVNNRLGLGTSAPDLAFHISRNTGAGLKITDTAVTDASWEIRAQTTNTTKLFRIIDSTAGLDRLTIDSSGRVGIGTNPVNKLDVSGSISASGAFSNTGYAPAVHLGVASGNPTIASGNNVASTYLPLVFTRETTTGSTETARFDGSGRLLVGTSSARSNFNNTSTETFAFQIEGTSVPTSGMALINDAANSTPGVLTFAKQRSGSIGGNTIVSSGDTTGFISFEGSDGSEFVRSASISAAVDGTPGANDMPGRLVFSVTRDGQASPTEALRIANNGLIDSFCAGSAYVVRTATGAGTGAELFHGLYSATGGATGGTSSIKIYTNGNIQNANNSYGSLSDIKLKENIVDANSQWDDLKALQVRNYNFKEGQTHTQIGLIAQEAELVSPGLVTESPDRDEEGNDLGTVTKSVNYSVLYMKAVKALQEAMERIETLESENTTLKDDFIELAARVSALEGN